MRAFSFTLALSLFAIFTSIAGGVVHANDIEIAEGLQKLEIYPPRFELDGQRRRLQLVVTARYTNGETRDVTRLCRWTISDETIARVDRGVVRPIKNGSVEIRASVGNLFAGSLVEVTRQEKVDAVSFQHETLPALSTQSCNSGPCHGSPSGKGGFRLSLRAFDAGLDRQTLLRESLGRRVDFFDPAKSLILLKPLGRVPHGGGTRLRTSDPAYDVLHRWIAEGCAVDGPKSPTLQGIEIYPGHGRELRWRAATARGDRHRGGRTHEAHAVHGRRQRHGQQATSCAGR